MVHLAVRLLFQVGYELLADLRLLGRGREKVGEFELDGILGIGLMLRRETQDQQRRKDACQINASALHVFTSLGLRVIEKLQALPGLRKSAVLPKG
ncbi:MAG: hypothetical protein CVU57_30250 [Deltaproteobacteria bacterium HGW-Deltaproteobacteria-15]|nr:MAG: hypothetical protein CVU57_30250 [Deltaproteobacteria bacterium HGW-Deltaproteobacteria-15]